MAMPLAHRKRWTADEARELNRKNPKRWPRYEVIDGELLVTNAPRLLHQEAVLLLARRLAEYMERVPIGRALIAPADIELEPDSTVSPDVFVTRLVNGKRPQGWSEVTGLWVVAEVLSPSTARYDRVVKRAYFGRNGVPEYWVVDLDARVVERWHPGDDHPVMEAERLVWSPAGESETFALDLTKYFADICAE